MKMARIDLKHIMALIGSVAGLCWGPGMAAAWGDSQTLSSPKDGIAVTLKTDVQGSEARAGTPFTATLASDVQCHSRRLPQGTEFSGEITKIHHSHRFGRPGYVVLRVTDARLPDGRAIHLDKSREFTIHQRDTQTIRQMVVGTAPYTLAGLAVTIPLMTVGGASGVGGVFIGQGVRMLAGATAGVFRPKYKQEPLVRKVALGTLDGAGTQRAVGFANLSPEADFLAGETITLYLHPESFQNLMETSASAGSSPPVAAIPAVTPQTPTSPASGKAQAMSPLGSPPRVGLGSVEEPAVAHAAGSPVLQKPAAASSGDPPSRLSSAGVTVAGVTVTAPALQPAAGTGQQSDGPVVVPGSPEPERNP